MEVINIGITADDGTGDPIRTAFDKTNDNFSELLAAVSGMSGVDVSLSFDEMIAIQSKLSAYKFVPGDYATLEIARTDGGAAGKTVVVTTPLTEAQSNITAAWPADRALRVEKGGSIANSTEFIINSDFYTDGDDKFVGSGTVTFSKFANTKLNINDYATLSANVLGTFASFTKANFDAGGLHAAGTVGTMDFNYTVPAYYYGILKITIATTTSGNVKILRGTTNVIDDQPAGCYFSTATPLLDGTENNRILTATDYYFVVTTSASALALTLETDTAWTGTISAVEMYDVIPQQFVIAGASTLAGGETNPIGIKAGAYGRYDLSLGDRYASGAFQYDGASPTPSSNVAIGGKALASNQHGDENTAVGTYALMFNEGSNNTAVGYSALKINNKGQENTAVGYKSMTLVTTGYRNTAVGFWAGTSFKTGSLNSFLGWMGNYDSEGGEHNSDTFIGAQAGNAILVGNTNTIVGAKAGTNTSTNNPTLTITGATALGYAARPFGNYAVAIGQESICGAESTLAANNIAIGYKASSTGTYYSVAMGYLANATGERSVSVGEESDATGIQSIAVGPLSQATANYTVSVGSKAGTLQTGTANTFVGVNAGLSATTQTYTNSTALGANSVISASNQVRIGSSAVTSIGGQVGWTTVSDARAKTDVVPLDKGLDFIESLTPVEYTLISGNGKKDMGFIAQDIEAVLGEAYNLLQINEDANRTLALRYTDIIAPLVKAVQELSLRVKELESQLNP